MNDSAWMFEEREEGSAGRSVQIMYTALTRIFVVIAHRPLRPIVVRLAQRRAA